MIFYKGTLKSCLTDRFVPGIVTTDIRIANKWKERLRSKNACIVEIDFKGHLDAVSTTKRLENINHWLPNKPSKARLNTPCQYKII